MLFQRLRQGFVLGACCAFAAPLLAIEPTPTHPPAIVNARPQRRAQQMFRIIRADALRIHLASQRLKESAKKSDFAQAGKELSTIEPNVKDMENRLARLKAMPLEDAQWDRHRLEASAPLISEIEKTRNRLHALLDNQGPRADPRVSRSAENYAENLMRQSQELEDAASAAGLGLS